MFVVQPHTDFQLPAVQVLVQKRSKAKTEPNQVWFRSNLYLYHNLCHDSNNHESGMAPRRVSNYFQCENSVNFSIRDFYSKYWNAIRTGLVL